MERTDIAILGGGVAGASLAFHLARGGADVTLLERAAEPGAHASGRNARLVLQPTRLPLVRRFTVASARAFTEHAEEVGFARTGSLLLGPRELLESLRAPAEFASEMVDGTRAHALAPSLQVAAETAALFTPGDGVLDPFRLLRFYLDGARAAGARVEMGCEVTAIAGEGPFELRAGGRPLRAERVVNAAGAWAVPLAARAGATALPLVAYKRHLFLLDVETSTAEPYVWEKGTDLYYRGDTAGTLACFCDEERTADLAETVSPGAETTLRARLGATFPWLRDAPLARAWSCFRVKSPDMLPAIGPDPRQPRFWWLAALYGYGLCSSWEIGRVAARGLLDGAETLPAEVLPARFAA